MSLKICNLHCLVCSVSRTYIAKEEFLFYWAEFIWNFNHLCPVHILFLTFYLGLVLPKCFSLSWFPIEILCVFLISPVRFSFPIYPTAFQFTIHHHSVTSTIDAAPHCTILFIPLLIPLSSHQISPLAPVLAQYFRFYSCGTQIKTHTIEHNSV